MTDYSAFELGRNVATSPGKVVYQTDLMQLIQYSPSTEQVWRTPLLIIPPWINKFYILDLREKNSFIRWATAQGHTVFVISWVNPDQRFAGKGFEDYMLEGPLAALKAIEQATGEREVNVIGYCLGGTLLACLLSWLQARGERRIKSATFFTAMIDFREPGELGVFVDEPTVDKLERKMAERGYLEGTEMATTFNLLRANDLIWSFVVNNYLLGKDPFPFDLLFWNSDSTRMPAKMHTFYLRNMYIKNLLTKPGAMRLAGEPIDVTKVDVPACFVSTIEDHIAPWKSTYMGAKLLGGPVTFILAGSGHIAGVVNPPSANKYGHWTNEQLPATADEWLASAQRHEGSWWSTWNTWVARFSSDKVAARMPGKGKLEALEDAPGSYAKLRLDAKQAAPTPAPAAPSTQDLLDEVARAVAAAAPGTPEELKEASRHNRALREHDQLAAHDTPAPKRTRPAKKA
jgi:polyhydroxyalkanoate synthase